MNTILSDIREEFRRHKRLADRALSVLDDASFLRRPGELVNPIAVIVKHLAGNLVSRWTDFLTSDGEKPTRNRDTEFVLENQDTRAQLMARWEAGWTVLFDTLEALRETDLGKSVAIRGEALTVHQALVRGLAHAAYHTGQIAYLSRLGKPESPWLTIAPSKAARIRQASSRD